jgi:3-deoxy-manno-octulosonate cytidylyltransferase (CMP-KDO synthetase)
MRAIGIIPARFGSTRFPGKPLALIKGKSLLQRTFERASLCKRLDRVVVATDHPEIYTHVQGFGGEVYMTSPECPNGTERIGELLDKEPSLKKYDIVVNIQGDEPCITPEVIRQVIEALAENKMAQVATPVAPLAPADAMNRSVVKCVRSLKGKALYFSRSLLPGGMQGEYNGAVPYYKHVGIYAYRMDFLPLYRDLGPTLLQKAESLEQLKILEHGFDIQTVLVDYQGVDVNHPEDIGKVEEYLWKQNIYS